MLLRLAMNGPSWKKGRAIKKFSPKTFAEAMEQFEERSGGKTPNWRGLKKKFEKGEKRSINRQ
jgi:hypothetical protein